MQLKICKVLKKTGKTKYRFLNDLSGFANENRPFWFLPLMFASSFLFIARSTVNKSCCILCKLVCYHVLY